MIKFYFVTGIIYNSDKKEIITNIIYNSDKKEVVYYFLIYYNYSLYYTQV